MRIIQLLLQFLLATCAGLSASCSRVSTQGANYHPGIAGNPSSDAPVVSSIEPATGYSLGGTVVTLNGSSFQPATSVIIGGSACRNIQVISDKALTCITPSHAVGEVGVEVMNGARAYSLNQSFQYIPMPALKNNLAASSAGGTSQGGGVALRFMGGAVGSPVQAFGGGLRLRTGIVGTQATN